jgi:hypothetical protein
MTTTRRLILTAAANLAAFLVLATAAVAGSLDTVTMDTAPTVPPAANAPNLAASAMAHTHGCWAPDARPGVLPGHIVVTREGSTVPVYGGQVIVAQALAQLEGHDHGLTVHALCR